MNYQVGEWVHVKTISRMALVATDWAYRVVSTDGEHLVLEEHEYIVAGKTDRITRTLTVSPIECEEAAKPYWL